MQLFHERAVHRSGRFNSSDEEECFTADGRKLGVWLTTEPLTGPTVLSTTVAVTAVRPYEVPADDGHRTFVVPVDVVKTWTLEPVTIPEPV